MTESDEHVVCCTSATDTWLVRTDNNDATSPVLPPSLKLQSYHRIEMCMLSSFFDTGTQFLGKKKSCYAKKKIRRQAGMVFTPPPPSQNYQEVE